MLAVIGPQKITFGEMHFTSVRGGLLHFEALAAKTTNPQQNNLKPPECDRNHRSTGVLVDCLGLRPARNWGSR
jgi:hypothetical protein